MESNGTSDNMKQVAKDNVARCFTGAGKEGGSKNGAKIVRKYLRAYMNASLQDGEWGQKERIIKAKEAVLSYVKAEE